MKYISTKQKLDQRIDIKWTQFWSCPSQLLTAGTWHQLLCSLSFYIFYLPSDDFWSVSTIFYIKEDSRSIKPNLCQMTHLWQMSVFFPCSMSENLLIILCLKLLGSLCFWKTESYQFLFCIKNTECISAQSAVSWPSHIIFVMRSSAAFNWRREVMWGDAKRLISLPLSAVVALRSAHCVKAPTMSIRSLNQE